MEIKVNESISVNPAEQVAKVQKEDTDFKFILTSHIEEAGLQARLNTLMDDITMQGKKLGKRMDVSDLKRYKLLVKEFMNEVVNRSHEFSRENLLDRRGRHRVYGIIRQVDDNLVKLAELLVADEKDHLAILNTIDEIRGLLLDIFM